ncbi:MAG: DMT family transporter [Actinomycetota bacterium]|nr:DMT family transporter [Actinomycetota bacterium]
MRLALLALIWGSSFVWIKIGLRGFTPMQVTFLRLLLAAGVLLLACRFGRLRLRREPIVWVHFAVAATVGNVVPFYLIGVGELSIDSSLAGVLNATTPLWTVTVALLVRSERTMSPARAASLLLGFGGTLVIFAPWGPAAAWVAPRRASLPQLCTGCCSHTPAGSSPAGSRPHRSVHWPAHRRRRPVGVRPAG